MNIRDHLSQETLELFLSGKVSDEMKRVTGVHLSYCPVCRDRKDDLALSLAAQRMWETYDHSAASKTHIEENAFRDFWLGKINDEELLNQISHHCIVCRDCRQKREQVRLEIREEQLQAGAWVRTWLMLTALAHQLRRPRVLLVALPLLVLLFVLIKVWPTRQTPQPQFTKKDESHAPVGPPTQDVANINSSPTPSVQNPQVQKPQTPPQKPKPPDVTGELLAQAQKVDLSDVADFREPESRSVKTNFTIVASRSVPTPLRILLPAHSRQGAYDVSIRDRAFLTELVPAKAKSSNGKNLFALMDLRKLKPGYYVLRVTRRDLKTRRDEYVGDYNVRIIESESNATP